MLTLPQILATGHYIAVCGTYLGDDNVHVGIYLNYEGKQRIFHFNSPNDIRFEDVSSLKREYHFNPIPNYPEVMLPSLIGFCDLAAHRKYETLTFNRNGVVYNGGTFNLYTGNYGVKTSIETIVNCAVFVIGSLKTFRYELIDWDSWPLASSTHKLYLMNYFNEMKIHPNYWDAYYNQAKVLRGKHVLSCAHLNNTPIPYTTASPISDRLIYNFQNP